MNAVVPLQFLAAYMMLRTLETLAEQVLISQRATKVHDADVAAQPVYYACGVLRRGEKTSERARSCRVVAGSVAPVTICPTLLRFAATHQNPFPRFRL